jgi:hypothetical protein
MARIVVVVVSASLVVAYLISASHFRGESREKRPSDTSVAGNPQGGAGRLESVQSLSYLMGAVLIVLGLAFWLQGRRADARLALLIAGACGLLPVWPFGLACLALAVYMGWGVKSDTVPAAPSATDRS